MSAGEASAGATQAPADGFHLARRARWLLFGITLPLFVVVLVLSLVQYRDQREQVLRDLAVASGTFSISLDTIAKLSNDHVLQMQTWSEGYIANPPAFPHSLRSLFTQRMVNGRPDGYSLDAATADMPPLIGQVLWLGPDPKFGSDETAPVDHALDFFGLVRLTHSLTPYFQWSYFFPASRKYITIFPWAPSRDFVKGTGKDTLNQGMASWFNYEIYTAGTPERNPSRRIYWTAPYFDAAGSGAMVSVGAPVYLRDEFYGVVGTDVKLSTLEDFLARLPHAVGRLWVVDASNRVLADSRGSEVSAKLGIRTFDDLRPAGMDPAGLALARQAPGTSVSAGEHTLVARPSIDAPWTLIYSVSDSEITRLLWPRFVPYAVILAILAANFFIALYLLRRQLIGPALQLATYIQRAARAPVETPRLPPLWQPVVNVVADALAATREATRQLQQSEAFKSAIVDNALLAVVTVDEFWRIVEFNPAAEVIFQHREPMVLGKDMIDLLIAPAQRATYRNELERFVGKDRRELMAVRADGSSLPVEISLSEALVDGRRFATAFVADLTARKDSEREMASQREALRQSEKLSAMGALLAGVAHELNNPLAILMGRSALLERKAVDPVVKADATKIHAAADRCGRIVRTFLSMARQKPAQRKRVHIADVTAGAVELVGYNLRSSGIELDVDVPAWLPALEADADQLGQVLVNLLINAQQALGDQPEPRHVRITARADDNGVILRVADNGPGVSDAVRDRIFDPFFTTKPEGTGTGLGLSVSRAILREHGGDLRLAETDVGCVFELRIPLTGPLPAGVPDIGATPMPMQRTSHALVVDDEPEVAQLLCDILRSAGCTAVAVTSGRDALAWLRTHTCSFILSDVRMPDMDGPALWKALREEQPQMIAHLAFVTGDTLSASVAPFLRETGLPSLEKPFTPDELLALVARIESD